MTTEQNLDNNSTKPQSISYNYPTGQKITLELVKDVYKISVDGKFVQNTAADVVLAGFEKMSDEDKVKCQLTFH